MKFSLLFLLAICFMQFGIAQKQKVWIDADTGNEMDDLYAISYLLLDTTVDVVGISSAHFNNADLITYKKWNAFSTKNINSVKISQQLNEKLLKFLNRENIPHPMGANQMIGRSWGGQEPSPSAASAMIIQKAHQMKAGEKLDILVTGASSNISSALLTDSTIKDKLRIYLLGASYFSDNKVWNKNEFNIRNDLNSFDYLLNLQGLEMIVMPVNVAIALQFKRNETKARLENKSEFFTFLYKQWDLVNATDSWIMWDVALIEAYLDPSLAKMQTAKTPPENVQRQIAVYSSVDQVKMEEIYWKRLLGAKLK